MSIPVRLFTFYISLRDLTPLMPSVAPASLCTMDSNVECCSADRLRLLREQESALAFRAAARVALMKLCDGMLYEKCSR